MGFEPLNAEPRDYVGSQNILYVETEKCLETQQQGSPKIVEI